MKLTTSQSRLVNDYSRLMWVAFLKEKSDAFQHFKIFKKLAEAESDEKVKCLRADRGGDSIQKNSKSIVMKME